MCIFFINHIRMLCLQGAHIVGIASFTKFPHRKKGRWLAWGCLVQDLLTCLPFQIAFIYFLLLLELRVKYSPFCNIFILSLFNHPTRILNVVRRPYYKLHSTPNLFFYFSSFIAYSIYFFNRLLSHLHLKNASPFKDDSFQEMGLVFLF